MTKILVINGPNLNNLGHRDSRQYGSMTLPEIETVIAERAVELGVEVAFFQSNYEGAIVDFLQENSKDAVGIVINPAALTGVGYSLGDALRDTGLPLIEIHLSNIHAREEFRRHSVVAPIAVGQISGLGWRGYIYGLEHMANHLQEGHAS